MRSLERLRRARAADMLAESRARLGVARATPQQVAQPAAPRGERLMSPAPFDLGASRHAPAAAQNPAAPPPQPAPIAEVLRDLYEEEKKTA